MDQETRDEFKSLREFLQHNMVTKTEFDQRFETIPTREDFHQLQIAVDGFAKQSKDNDEELLILGDRASRMESWIIKAAAKIGLDYKP